MECGTTNSIQNSVRPCFSASQCVHVFSDLPNDAELFVAREPLLVGLEQATNFQFAPGSAKPKTGPYDLDATSLAAELQQLKAEYDTASGGEPLVKGAGGQWVLPSEEIGYEALDVAEWDASKEKHQEFDETFEGRESTSNRQEALAFPVVEMKDGVPIGPGNEVGDAQIGDMTRAQAPSTSAPAASYTVPAKQSASKDQLPGALQLLSRHGKQEVNLGKTASSTGYFT